MLSRESSVPEDLVTVFNNKLNGGILSMHIGHFAFKAVVPHDGGCKDDSKVLRCHLHGVISRVKITQDNGYLPSFHSLYSRRELNGTSKIPGSHGALEEAC